MSVKPGGTEINR